MAKTEHIISSCPSAARRGAGGGPFRLYNSALTANYNVRIAATLISECAAVHLEARRLRWRPRTLAGRTVSRTFITTRLDIHANASPELSVLALFRVLLSLLLE
ncbi:hypothetical protein EVAR_102222_1 [Eumeta japonica]|uniref:Uncharacterized protein n=1 Tax=Eumeta variegata TaxID=151549 RepID=A0A4C1WFV9_EUMVA|nr:hypothetical protein EVAR_102222_1 [Eumeta japonica]